MVERFADKQIRLLESIFRETEKSSTCHVLSEDVEMEGKSFESTLSFLNRNKNIEIEWVGEIPFENELGVKITDPDFLLAEVKVLDRAELEKTLSRLKDDYPKKDRSVLREQTAELIARAVGDLTNGLTLERVLLNSGVDKALVVYPNTKWKMVFDALNYLCRSNKNEDIVALKTLLNELCHPLIHNQDTQKAKDFEMKLNSWLEYDGLRLINGNLLELTPTPKKTETNKTSTDRVAEIVDFLRQEYNKAKIQGLEYEVLLRELCGYNDENDDEFTNKREALEQLKNAGLITDYRLKVFQNDSGSWEYAICKINETRLFKMEAPQEPPTNQAMTEAPQGKPVVVHVNIHNENNNAQQVDVLFPSPDASHSTANGDNSGMREPKDGLCPDLKWDRIEMKFENGHDVMIAYGDKQTKSNYEKMGFEDSKKKLPNTQWEILHFMAEHERFIGFEDSKRFTNDLKSQKKELSQKLQKYFGIKSDPFEYINSEVATGYLAKFSLRPEKEAPKTFLRDIE